MKAHALILLTSVLLSACGGKDDGPTGKKDPLTTTEGLCDAWAKGACNDDIVRRCGSANTSDCVAAQADFCAELLGDGPFVATYAKACIADVEVAYTDSILDYEEWQNVVLAVAGSCADLNPAVNGAGGAGSGDPATLRGAGDDCDPEGDVCVDTHYCDEDVAICRTKARPGEACCENDPMLILPACTPRPCQSSAYCDGPSGEQVCIGRGGASDECSTDAECAVGLFCAEGVNGKTCVAEVFFGTGTPQCDDLG